jgi:hypothetical protein
LIRQLAYDFRQWKSLEAIGRAGSDEGIDILGRELITLGEEPQDGDEDAEPQYSDRLWVFQCKREKTLPPGRLQKVIDESLASLEVPPHGFILAVACDVSKAARSRFREEMIKRGIEEFFIWSRGELEDLLFQPKNDHLLFAYFGIALQPRRRNLSTVIRSEITKKKQLTALIEKEQGTGGTLVLLRDPTDDRYPDQPRSGEAQARWGLCRALHLKKPGHLAVQTHEYFAATSGDRLSWDATFDEDVLLSRAEGELVSAEAWGVDLTRDRTRSAYEFWNEYIDEADRAYLKYFRIVPLNRILALDLLGDGYFPIPHILGSDSGLVQEEWAREQQRGADERGAIRSRRGHTFAA